MCLQIIFIRDIYISYNVLWFLRQKGKFYYLHAFTNWGEFWILHLQGNLPAVRYFLMFVFLVFQTPSASSETLCDCSWSSFNVNPHFPAHASWIRVPVFGVFFYRIFSTELQTAVCAWEYHRELCWRYSSPPLSAKDFLHFITEMKSRAKVEV